MENYAALAVEEGEIVQQQAQAQVQAQTQTTYRNGYKVVTEKDGKIVYTINSKGNKHGYYRETQEGNELIEADYDDGTMIFYRTMHMNGLYKQEYDFLTNTFKWWYNRDQLFETGLLEDGGVFINNKKRITKKRWDEYGRVLYPWVAENANADKLTYAEANLQPGFEPQ